MKNYKDMWTVLKVALQIKEEITRELDADLLDMPPTKEELQKLLVSIDRAVIEVMDTLERKHTNHGDSK